MVMLSSLTEQVYLSFAISVVLLLYGFVVVLESRWSSGVSHLPLQDSCFPQFKVQVENCITSDAFRA
ncbi:hypothetical protein LguiA_029616 [Lonicera macranthoides]